MKVLCKQVYAFVYICKLRYVCKRYVCKVYIYGVAATSRLLKFVGLFCRISSLLYVSFAKETYNFRYEV